MLPVDNDVVEGKTIFLDDRYFVNCKFTKCSLIYAGGDFGWQGAEFIERRISLRGPEDRTIKFLENVGMMQPL